MAWLDLPITGFQMIGLIDIGAATVFAIGPTHAVTGQSSLTLKLGGESQVLGTSFYVQALSLVDLASLTLRWSNVFSVSGQP